MASPQPHAAPPPSPPAANPAPSATQTHQRAATGKGPAGDRRLRHGLDAREQCYLCDQARETIDHIVASRPYTREVWTIILHAFGRLLPPATQFIISWWRRLRADWNGVQRSGIDSLFALVSWEVWKERNARCFRAAAVAPVDLISAIRAEAGRWAKAGASGLSSLATPGAG